MYSLKVPYLTSDGCIRSIRRHTHSSSIPLERWKSNPHTTCESNSRFYSKARCTVLWYSLDFKKIFQYRIRGEAEPDFRPLSQSPLVDSDPFAFLTSPNARIASIRTMSLIRSHSQWPGGGYPSFIRGHKTPVAWEGFDAATRAWRCFVRDQWVGDATADQRKRDLIERWATVDQEFRDVSKPSAYIVDILFLSTDSNIELSISSTGRRA